MAQAKPGPSRSWAFFLRSGMSASWNGACAMSSSTEPATSTMAIYYVGDTPDGPRLFREFRRLGGDPLATAVSAVFGKLITRSVTRPIDDAKVAAEILKHLEMRAYAHNLVMEGGGRVGDYVGGYTDWLRQRSFSGWIGRK